MKRIFIAVDIPDEARRIIASYIEELRRRFPNARVGWERPEKLHLTLKFIGRIDDIWEGLYGIVLPIESGNSEVS